MAEQAAVGPHEQDPPQVVEPGVRIEIHLDRIGRRGRERRVRTDQQQQVRRDADVPAVEAADDRIAPARETAGEQDRDPGHQQREEHDDAEQPQQDEMGEQHEPAEEPADDRDRPEAPDALVPVEPDVDRVARAGGRRRRPRRRWGRWRLGRDRRRDDDGAGGHRGGGLDVDGSRWQRRRRRSRRPQPASPRRPRRSRPRPRRLAGGSRRLLGAAAVSSAAAAVSAAPSAGVGGGPDHRRDRGSSGFRRLGHAVFGGHRNQPPGAGRAGGLRPSSSRQP